jgi:hypothetical protein
MESVLGMVAKCMLYLESCEQYDSKEALPQKRVELLDFALELLEG